ncbi:MAG TPA: family 20 glycosylhydrolase, partial [Terriglobia bacterium]|nr:family 20 glycosylhydrolase [Terriglobia bacterium]
YYLDLMQPASRHYQVDPMKGATAGLSPEEKSRILGGEACMWVEFVTTENVDSRIWPRLAAIAERLWSPEEVTDVDSMYRRLEIESRRLDTLGLTHRSSYPVMLERLTALSPIGGLRTLADLLEPVKEYAREEARAYTSLTPLNRLVDAERPESDAAREFAALVADWKSHRGEIRQRLTRWRDDTSNALPLMQRSALLQEDVPLAEDVSALSAAGLQALDYLDSGKPAPAAWVTEQLALCDRAAKPRAELLIMMTPSIRALVEASQSK